MAPPHSRSILTTWRGLSHFLGLRWPNIESLRSSFAPGFLYSSARSSSECWTRCTQALWTFDSISLRSELSPKQQTTSRDHSHPEPAALRVLWPIHRDGGDCRSAATC